MFNPSEEFMRLAFDKAREGVDRGESPFGACIVDKEGNVLSIAYNTVISTNDPTAHAEINAIRQASKSIGSWNLSNTVIYSTTEPCPMCLSAIHWARIPIVVYSTSIEDVAKLGFNEILVRDEQMVEMGKMSIQLIGGFLREEGLELLRYWLSKGNGVY